MAQFGEAIEPTFEAKQRESHSREILFLAEQAAGGRMKVLPGETWAFHYPESPEVRNKKLQGILDGDFDPEEVAQSLKPDALFYNEADIESEGVEGITSRVRDLSTLVEHYDYERFAKFLHDMKGRDIPLEALEATYDNLAHARIQKQLMDAYGSTGREQLATALRAEAGRMQEGLSDLSPTNKVLNALKMNWIYEELGYAGMEERDRVIAELSGRERELFESLESSYREYVHRGMDSGYQDFEETIMEGMPELYAPEGRGEASRSMQELEEKLEPYMEEIGLPGSPEDSAIPPDDKDEYHTHVPLEGERPEQLKQHPYFEIDPPLSGYYAGGRKSYYDVETKTWSKKKELSSYDTSIEGEGRHTFSGRLDRGLKAIGIPNNYTLDTSSLQYSGEKPEIFRDQNGCFYMKTGGPSSFSIDFLEEPEPFIAQPIKEDTAPLYKGALSGKTEKMMSRLVGDPLQKAEQARQHILANHFYPGGGDLQKAQALQYKLRHESTPDNYLQNLDTSEYLECYSANTKFVAIMRQAGVSARLVLGDKVESVREGKSVIDQNTGHAWSEIWDGEAWRRFDATPPAKPEDKKESEEPEEPSPETENADDGGVEGAPEESGEQSGDGGQGEGKGTADPLEQMQNSGEATDSDIDEAVSRTEEAKEQVDTVSQKKRDFDKKVEEAEKFQDLANLQKEIKDSELFDDMKQELEQKMEAKEGEMRDEIKEVLDDMEEDGFMDAEKKEELEKQLEEGLLEELDRIKQQIEQENELYNNYEKIREDVMPLVEEWFKYFVERLPKKEEIEFDEDSLTRQGAFNRRAVMKPRNLLFGTVKNPRKFLPSVEPRFMASILLDVSGSMQGDKLHDSRKLLIFYSELFSRISTEFGYIRFSINIFSDSVKEIKNFDQDYDSSERYEFQDGTHSTVKVRLMKELNAGGGTNMLDAVLESAKNLNEESAKYPDYASAFYFVGDGEDTCGNSENVREFLKTNDEEQGFGKHMQSAILLGSEAERQKLADIFGDEHTNVVPELDQLIERSMEKVSEDIEEYLKSITR